MKKLTLITCLATAIFMISCGDDVKRKPSNVYMPDMAYSRAYETYADHSNLTEQGINYNAKPVAGTIARGEDFSFPLKMDKLGDTVNYFASRSIVNPIDSLSEAETVEAERMYLIHCGVCHGKNLDGNGPLFKGGDGPYPAKPATLVGDAKYEAMPAGQMYYSVTYGKNAMGSYASQLNRKQRWQIIAYIKAKQKSAKK